MVPLLELAHRLDQHINIVLGDEIELEVTHVDLAEGHGPARSWLAKALGQLRGGKDKAGLLEVDVVLLELALLVVVHCHRVWFVDPVAVGASQSLRKRVFLVLQGPNDRL